MKTTLIVLLGCNILSILYDRVNTAINFVSNIESKSVNSFSLLNMIKPKQKNSFHWILTGGIKNDILKNTKPEAEIMLGLLQQQNFINHQFIIDSNSTNTVENFIFLHKYLNTSNNYNDIYIITSNFHHSRAKKIADKISPYNNYKWILGKEETSDLVFWENYHINNVDRDILRAVYANNFTIESIIKDEL